MSKIPSTLIQSLAALPVLLPMVVQAETTKAVAPVPDVATTVAAPAPNVELNKRFVEKVGGVAAVLVLTAKGEVVALNAKGQYMAACQPGVEKSSDPKVPPCGKTAATAIRSVKSLSIVDHKGSDCLLIELPPNEGSTLYYDTCTGKIL